MKKKIAKIFNTIPEENSSYKAIFANLDERGKLDFKKMIDVVVMMIEEIEAIPLRKAMPEEPKTVKPKKVAKQKTSIKK